MKKIVVVILAAVYLLSAIGVSASSFYCCGVLKSTTLTFGELHGPGSKALGKDDQCCKHTKQTFKVKDHHYGAKGFWLSAKFFPAIIETGTPSAVNAAPALTAHTAFYSHAPPLGYEQPLFILYCTYRI